MEVQGDFNTLPWEFDVQCEQCGKTYTTTKYRYTHNAHNFCSKKCSGDYKKKQTVPNCECVICHKPLHRKPSYINSTKNITCSYECCYKLKQITMAGENNHQYGLKGEINSSFKNEKRITVYGYNDILNWEHPFHNSSGRVFEHRIVAEKFLLDDINSIEINGIRYLRPEFTVHHIDFNRQNNNINNLCVMRKESHTSFHKYVTKYIVNQNGETKIMQKINNNLSKEKLSFLLKEYIKTYNVYYHMIDSIKLVDKDELDIPIVDDIKSKISMKSTKILTVKDIREILNTSQEKTYKIINRVDFPKFKMGHKYLISSEKFYEYICNKCGLQTNNKK